MPVNPERFLVPVSSSRTLRSTVEYVVDSALDTASAADPATVRFVYVHSPEVADATGLRKVQAGRAERLLRRIDTWAAEDAGDRVDELVVETDELGADTYLFSPDDVAEVLLRDAREHDVTRIVIDPEYDPGIGAPLLRPLEYELSRATEFTIEEAPVVRTVRRPPLLRQSTPRRFAAVFAISFVFYQLLAGQFAPFDLVTGAVSATIVAVALSRISLSRDPTLESLRRLLRMCLYVPYLLWEILKANVAVAAVILHPRLPIEPRMTRVRFAVWGTLPVTTLANSITLTPGTLSVRIQGRDLLVHTLVPGAREDLFEGSLERAVRFVFYGRGAMRHATPRERDDVSIVPASESVSSELLDGAAETEGEAE